MTSETTTWVIKLSKLCNMRCSYCYEWNELGNPARMPISTWQNVLDAMAEHSQVRLARRQTSPPASLGEKLHNLVVLHGGEPLTLPTSYLQEVLARYAASARADPNSSYSLHVQSNLLSVNEEKLQLLLAHDAQLAFSYDVRPGVRLNVAGQPSETTVAANIDRLLARGIALSGIAVLARHTVDHVCEVYDFFARRGLALRILPLFDGPANRPQERFAIDPAAIVRGLETLFRHWMATGCKVPVYPFVNYFETTLRFLAKTPVTTWNRAEHGDAVLLINNDGRVFRVLDAYREGLELGDLSGQSMRQLLASEKYRLSLLRDRQEFERHCRGCRYLGACSGSPVHETQSSEFFGNCPVAHSAISFMEAFVREQGFGEGEVRELLMGLPRPVERKQGELACG